MFTLALGTRVLGDERYVTVDETIHWTPRVDAFAAALGEGRFADTALAPHPGVVTMWCGALGRSLHRAAVATRLSTEDAAAQRWWLRLPAKLVTAACPAIAAWALARVLGARAAVLAGLLWAADPFVLAHARILHVDALGASLAALAIVLLLSALTAVRPDGRWLAAAGVAAGLATLTRLPMGLVAPWMVAATLWQVPSWSERRRVVAITGGAAIAAFVGAWPAMWVDPGAAIVALGQGVTLGAREHEHGNYFLGEPTGDPGLLFYAVAVPLRLAPWVMLALPVALLRHDRSAADHRARVLLWGWIVVLGAVLAVFGKKFDRYALGLFPILDILAAVGLVGAMQWLGARLSRPVAIPPVALAIVLAIDAWWWHPYPLARYNPLLGGAPVAARAILVGWGEGLDLAADAIAARTDDCTDTVAAKEVSLLDPLLCQRIVPLGRLRRADFVVGYVKDLQRQDPALAPVADRPPDATILLHGVEYARIWDQRAAK